MKNTTFVIVIVGFLVSLFLVTFSSLINIYEKKENISKLLRYKFGFSSLEKNHSYKPKTKDIYWAKEILKGGYILHFRHAERDKWIDVQMYDLLESDLHENGLNGTRYAEDDYFDKAVCLNERGKIQARAMGEHIVNIGLPIGLVTSSVSCRSRQTADLSFGGYDTLHRLLVHTGPYNEDPLTRIQNLKDFYYELQIKKEKNTIVSAHNSVIYCEMFINDCSKKPYLEEGGFYVISKRKDGLYLEHEFHNFQTFAQVFYER
jgi:phosphohistidine phosphatase SixA